MRRPSALAAIVFAAALALVGCSSTDTNSSDATSAAATETSVAAPATTETETGTTTSETATTSAAPAVMPNVVCMNLQEAQNKIQDAGVFFSRSEDATGAGRNQLVDSNWVVVSQTPAAGSTVTEGEAVLSAVKIGEPSSC